MNRVEFKSEKTGATHAATIEQAILVQADDSEGVGIISVIGMFDNGIELNISEYIDEIGVMGYMENGSISESDSFMTLCFDVGVLVNIVNTRNLAYADLRDDDCIDFYAHVLTEALNILKKDVYNQDLLCNHF